MSTSFCSTAAAFMLLVTVTSSAGGQSPASSAGGNVQQLAQQFDDAIEAGDFGEAERLLRRELQDAEGPAVQPHAVTLEILRRIRHEFALTPKQALQKIRTAIPDATAEDLERWRQAGVLQARVIDGRPCIFRREPANLLRFCTEAQRRYLHHKGDGATLPWNWKHTLTGYVVPLVQRAGQSSHPKIHPVKHEVEYRLTIPAGHPRVRQGATVSCWLPYPKEYRQQSSVRLLDSTPKDATIAPPQQPQRTIYFSQLIDKVDQPLVFVARYEFTTCAYCPRLEESQPVAVDPTDKGLQVYTSERLPHIVFTPRVREIVDEVVGGETNPLVRARNLFHWVCRNIAYCAEMEYSTIDSLSGKALTSGKGDCGVQAMAFITLCRAAGVPARWQSGWETLPRQENMHDWAEFYVEPWGWLPADPSYGLLEHEDPQVHEFYFGHLDPYRMIVNTDYARPLFPAKTSFRSEPNDFQRGEVEIDGHNLYFDEWDWEFTVQTTPLADTK